MKYKTNLLTELQLKLIQEMKTEWKKRGYIQTRWIPEFLKKKWNEI